MAIERLKHMNEPAILFYQDHHVDLFKERLEIAVCAQHNNGGLSTNHLWETNLSVEGLASFMCVLFLRKIPSAARTAPT